MERKLWCSSLTPTWIQRLFLCFEWMLHLSSEVKKCEQMVLTTGDSYMPLKVKGWWRFVHSSCLLITPVHNMMPEENENDGKVDCREPPHDPVEWLIMDHDWGQRLLVKEALFTSRWYPCGALEPSWRTRSSWLLDHSDEKVDHSSLTPDLHDMYPQQCKL